MCRVGRERFKRVGNRQPCRPATRRVALVVPFNLQSHRFFFPFCCSIDEQMQHQAASLLLVVALVDITVSLILLDLHAPRHPIPTSHPRRVGKCSSTYNDWHLNLGLAFFFFQIKDGGLIPRNH